MRTTLKVIDPRMDTSSMITLDESTVKKIDTAIRSFSDLESSVRDIEFETRRTEIIEHARRQGMTTDLKTMAVNLFSDMNKLNNVCDNVDAYVDTRLTASLVDSIQRQLTKIRQANTRVHTDNLARAEAKIIEDSKHEMLDIFNTRSIYTLAASDEIRTTTGHTVKFMYRDAKKIYVSTEFGDSYLTEDLIFAIKDNGIWYKVSKSNSEEDFTVL